MDTLVYREGVFDDMGFRDHWSLDGSSGSWWRFSSPQVGHRAAPTCKSWTPEDVRREMRGAVLLLLVAHCHTLAGALVGSGSGLPCKPFGRASVLAALDALRQGLPIVVTDDESRENEGDLIVAGEMATAENIGFVVRHSSGVLCISVPGERLEALELPPMVVNNEDPKGTAFTVSVDLKAGTSTGISAADRAATFRALADPTSTASDFARPGHVFPLRPREGGVLERDGHTEAAIDLCRLAGLQPAGVLCEVCNDDGSMARIPQLIPFCEQHGLVLTSIADLIEYIEEQGQSSYNDSLAGSAAVAA